MTRNCIGCEMMHVNELSDSWSDCEKQVKAWGPEITSRLKCKLVSHRSRGFHEWFDKSSALSLSDQSEDIPRAAEHYSLSFPLHTLFILVLFYTLRPYGTGERKHHARLPIRWLDCWKPALRAHRDAGVKRGLHVPLLNSAVSVSRTDALAVKHTRESRLISLE